MAKRKLQRFADINTFPNVIQASKTDYLNTEFYLKGKWAQEYFKNTNPIILELGCGKGEYTINLARKNMNINYIGIDVKGDRIWKGSKTALDNSISNVCFLRTQIEMIDYIFNENEVSGLWITFPDPQPNKPKIKKRLTSPLFLSKYKKILKPDGIINFKTDNSSLFNYSIDIIKQHNYLILEHTYDLYQSGITGDATETQTYYENIYLKQGIPICYMKFAFQ